MAKKASVSSHSQDNQHLLVLHYEMAAEKHFVQVELAPVFCPKGLPEPLGAADSLLLKNERPTNSSLAGM